MIANILIALIAALHVYILILQMAFWTKPAGRRAFRLSPEFAEASKVLAANQGLYNGFLAAGLIFSLTHGIADRSVAIFFLVCVFVAGIFGGLTAHRKIMVIQSAPALLALLAVLAGI